MTDTQEVYIENGPHKGQFVMVERQWHHVTVPIRPPLSAIFPSTDPCDLVVHTATYRIDRRRCAVLRGRPHSDIPIGTHEG